MNISNITKIVATATILTFTSHAGAFAITDKVDFREGSSAEQGVGKDFQIGGTGMRTSDGVYLSSFGADGHLWWDHDINDLYDSSMYNIDSATIYLDLHDDKCKKSYKLACGLGYDDPDEAASFDMALVEGGATTNAMGSEAFGTFDFVLHHAALADLRFDGVLDLLQIEVHDQIGRAADLYVKESRLVVQLTKKNGHPIPEPGGLALMAAGLIGFRFASKRKRQA